MSETQDPFEGEKKPQVQTQDQEVKPSTKKIFTLGDIKRFLTVKVVLPKLYPDYEPWEFDLRLKLSNEAEERRQEYLSLSASEQTVKLQEQALDEICDLLTAAPRGFGDFTVEASQNPGTAFKKYVEQANPAAKALLLQIVEGASNLYWSGILPREFRG